MSIKNTFSIFKTEFSPLNQRKIGVKNKIQNQLKTKGVSPQQIQQQMLDLTFQVTTSNASDREEIAQPIIREQITGMRQIINPSSCSPSLGSFVANNSQVISIVEFSRIAPNLKVLQELCSIQGFYVLKDASMKWFLRKYIEKQIPISDKIRRCSAHIKLTKATSIDIINKFYPQIEPELRHYLEWLRDIAYTTSQGQDLNFL